MHKRTSEMTEDELKARRTYGLEYYYRYHEKHKAENRERARSNPERTRANGMMKRFGLTLDQWEELFAFQDSVCACCSNDDPVHPKGWMVDHCHEREILRGIICWPCNIDIGRMGDTADLIARHVTLYLNYLQRTGDRPKTETLLALRQLLDHWLFDYGNLTAATEVPEL